MSTYVLIHGAMHGAWCWERVVPLLRSSGHTVIAPDLPRTWSGPNLARRRHAGALHRCVNGLLEAAGEPLMSSATRWAAWW